MYVVYTISPLGILILWIMEELLKKVGWTQVYFAQKVGVTPNTVNRWCKEEPNPVAMAYLRLVERLLG